MLKAGLVSVTFRQLAIEEIVELVVACGLAGIEWGGDVHVPHGDIQTAERAHQYCEDAGIVCCAYGSYYRAGEPVDKNNPDFEAVIETAIALGVPAIRVWAGRRSSTDADAAYRGGLVEDLRRIASMAADAGIVVTCEFHEGTLTDTHASALNLYQRVDHPNVRASWQPPFKMSRAECTEGLTCLLPWLWNLHIFEWTDVNGQCRRDPLESGLHHWREWLSIAAGTGRMHWALLEFVAGDNPELLPAEARTLNGLIAEVLSES